ncbi:MAG: NYN domain-containing protein [Patescibacteria group bacterium]
MIKVYIDMANLMSECRVKNIIIDMNSFYVWINDVYKATDVTIFTGYLSKYASEYRLNKKIGYTYIFKEAVFNKDESKIKANCDVDIAIEGAIDCVENYLDMAVLISSDGDFLSLIKFWQSRNIKVRLISPADPNKCSYLLKRINIPTTYLSQVVEKFIYTNEKALDEDETS